MDLVDLSRLIQRPKVQRHEFLVSLNRHKLLMYSNVIRVLYGEDWQLLSFAAAFDS